MKTVADTYTKAIQVYVIHLEVIKGLQRFGFLNLAPYLYSFTKIMLVKDETCIVDTLGKFCKVFPSMLIEYKSYFVLS